MNTPHHCSRNIALRTIEVTGRDRVVLTVDHWIAALCGFTSDAIRDQQRPQLLLAFLLLRNRRLGSFQCFLAQSTNSLVSIDLLSASTSLPT